MTVRKMFVCGCVSLLALGSAVALAQSGPSDAPSAMPPIAAPPPIVAQRDAPPPVMVPPPAPVRPEFGTSGLVEDAPIDEAPPEQPDWVPNDEPYGPNVLAPVAPAAPRTAMKARKGLNDIGDDGKVMNNWTSAPDDQAITTRAGRRARKMDPVKQSELARLSRVMGALHALRVSCSGRDDQTYRSRMATLLDLEAPGSDDVREPLVDAFNGGFQGYGRGSNPCPTDARDQEARLAKEGYALANTLSARYRPIPKPAQTRVPANQPRQMATPSK
jgi:uncharacterized protein (TIGR02301 family)